MHARPEQKQFTTHKAFFLHAAWLVQALAHWPIFLTAASRRSLDRVSVPMWGISLSGPLDIVGLVSRYLSNCLMSRMPVLNPLAGLSSSSCGEKELWDITPTFAGLSPCLRLVAYALRTRLPVAIRVLLLHAAPRLACVKPAASVHPEPGSNSSLSLIFFVISLFLWNTTALSLPYSWLIAINNSMYSFYPSNAFPFISRPCFVFGFANVHIFSFVQHFYKTFFSMWAFSSEYQRNNFSNFFFFTWF